MAKRTLGAAWKSICVSSSISNFSAKLDRKLGLPHWGLRTIFKPTLFIGCYHLGDYWRIRLHTGYKGIFWAGSDILAIQPWWRFPHTIHYCENEVEQVALLRKGIKAILTPSFFDLTEGITITYKHSNSPNVFLCAHKGREEEYGVNEIESIAWKVPYITFHIYGVEGLSWHRNVIYHGKVSEEQFNEEIQHYQAGIRLNTFDGFAEILARSALAGQYPISRIPYPHIDTAPDSYTLVRLLKKLRVYKEANSVAASYWKAIL